MTHRVECVFNISHDARLIPSSQPPKTYSDDAEDATACSKRAACIGAASAVSALSMLMASTLLQAATEVKGNWHPWNLVFNPPVICNFPKVK